MDIIKHIIYEERTRKQMYDNHECTALELEGRSFNEKILKLADRIEELQKQLDAVRALLEMDAIDGAIVFASGDKAIYVEDVKEALQGENE